METVTPTASLHDTAGLLVHNLDFAVLDYILVVEVEHGVGLQQLLEGVHTLALDGIVAIHLVLLHGRAGRYGCYDSAEQLLRI